MIAVVLGGMAEVLPAKHPAKALSPGIFVILRKKAARRSPQPGKWRAHAPIACPSGSQLVRLRPRRTTKEHSECTAARESDHLAGMGEVSGLMRERRVDGGEK